MDNLHYIHNNYPYARVKHHLYSENYQDNLWQKLILWNELVSNSLTNGKTIATNNLVYYFRPLTLCLLSFHCTLDSNIFISFFCIGNSESRQAIRNMFPSQATSNDALEIQQRALLEQQDAQTKRLQKSKGTSGSDVLYRFFKKIIQDFLKIRKPLVQNFRNFFKVLTIVRWSCMTNLIIFYFKKKLFIP